MTDILKTHDFSSSRQFFNFIGDNVSAEPFSSQFYKLILKITVHDMNIPYWLDLFRDRETQCWFMVCTYRTGEISCLGSY